MKNITKILYILALALLPMGLAAQVSYAPNYSALSLNKQKVRSSLVEIPYRSGNWLPAQPVFVNTTNSAMQHNRTYFTPIWLTQDASLTSIALRVSTQGSNTTAVKLGIYDFDASTGLPSTLLVTASAPVSITGATAIGVSLTTPKAIKGGLKYIGAVYNNTGGTSPSIVTINGYTCAGWFWPIIGGGTVQNAIATTGATTSGCGYGAVNANYSLGLSTTIPSNTFYLETTGVNPQYGIQLQ